MPSPLTSDAVYLTQRWQKEVNQLNRRNSTSLRIREEVAEAVEVAGEVEVVLEVEEEEGGVGDEVVSEVEVGIVELGIVKEVGVVG
jgi:hypothetical protein